MTLEWAYLRVRPLLEVPSRLVRAWQSARCGYTTHLPIATLEVSWARDEASGRYTRIERPGPRACGRCGTVFGETTPGTMIIAAPR